MADRGKRRRFPIIDGNINNVSISDHSDILVLGQNLHTDSRGRHETLAGRDSHHPGYFNPGERRRRDPTVSVYPVEVLQEKR